MPQEVSISYQAVKSKVYKLVDAMVEGDKNTIEVQESIRRWWKLIHPSDRAVAQKYLLMVLEKSNTTLGAIVLGLPEVKEVKAVPRRGHGKISGAIRADCDQQPGLKILWISLKSPALAGLFYGVSRSLEVKTTAIDRLVLAIQNLRFHTVQHPDAAGKILPSLAPTCSG